jgi:hypothetical protein
LVLTLLGTINAVTFRYATALGTTTAFQALERARRQAGKKNYGKNSVETIPGTSGATAFD